VFARVSVAAHSESGDLDCNVESVNTGEEDRANQNTFFAARPPVFNHLEAPASNSPLFAQHRQALFPAEAVPRSAIRCVHTRSSQAFSNRHSGAGSKTAPNLHAIAAVDDFA
jgi:hypothetical protein